MAARGEAGAEGVRLQKALARAGIGSRRACEELIAAGRVAVDGETAVLGRRVDPETDRITLDGVLVPAREGLVYYLLNKPRGVVTTAKDPQGRPTVLDLVPEEPRVVPAGRLDLDTEGLIVLTNDGDLVQTLTHPSRGVEKEYLAEVEGEPAPLALRRLREGVPLDDGVTAPARANLSQVSGGRAAVVVVVHEGRNRQVRRMLDEVGHPVRRLVRTRVGALADPDLAPGEWRRLEPAEVRALYEASSPRSPHPEPGEASS